MAGEGMLRIFDSNGLGNMNNSIPDSAWSMLKRFKGETTGDSVHHWGKRGFAAPSALDDLQRSSEYGQQAVWPASMRRDLDNGAPAIRDHFAGNSTEMPLFKSMFEVTADVDDQGTSNGVLPSNDFCISHLNMESAGSTYEHMQIAYPKHSLVFRAKASVVQTDLQNRIIPAKRRQRLVTLAQVNTVLFDARNNLYEMFSNTGICSKAQATFDPSKAVCDFETAGLIMRMFQFVGVLHGLDRAGSFTRSASMQGVMNRQVAGCVARVCPRGITPVTNFWGSNVCTQDGAGLWLVLNRRDNCKRAGSAGLQAQNQYTGTEPLPDNVGHDADYYWRFEPVTADSHHRLACPSEESLFSTANTSGKCIKIGVVRNNHASASAVSMQASKQLDRLKGRIRRAIYNTEPNVTVGESLFSQSLLDEINIAL
jgi:hypothetical protein